MSVRHRFHEPGPAVQRLRLELEGIVQGVGMRPTVTRLARSLDLAGWVANSAAGATVEVEGCEAAVAEFAARLRAELPPRAQLHGLRRAWLQPLGESSFTIHPSSGDGQPEALAPPDVAACAPCLSEVDDPDDRRHGYPFTSCTSCGPRFSILRALPYDRANTTMARFPLCAACRHEYETPGDRRFHAQANACPDCGPQLELLDASGRTLAKRHGALLGAVDALRHGRIVALKGLGGYQLLVDARDQDAVTELRRRKARPHKPFALMMPDPVEVRRHCELSALEQELLTSPEAPIVLLRRHAEPGGVDAPVASVAPDNPWLGVMLPCTPLHHLLIRALGFPVVATSGNLSGESIVCDDAAALQRLGGIAEVFLVHDRPIAWAVDDSVVRVMAGRSFMQRRARGYAPLAITLPRPAPPLLAVGAHLKCTVAVTRGARVIVGPHIGDLDSPFTRQALQRSIDGLCEMHGVRPSVAACDGHPDFHTTRVARERARRTIPVQHHVAHVAACMAEQQLTETVLGVTWDGSGYGADGTVWGGEFLVVDGSSWHRVARLHPFPLPGGDRAVTEPRRVAFALLHELCGARALAEPETNAAASLATCFSDTERTVLSRMLERRVNSPLTSSAGRLFDGVAALLGLVQVASFEGQAAMAVEFAANDAAPGRRHAMPLVDPGAGEPLLVDWRPMLRGLLADLQQGAPVAHLAAAFHDSLIDAIVAVARHVSEHCVVLSGGCFQNRRLTEGAVTALRTAGFEPYWPEHLPANDGGLAPGQAVWAARMLETEAP